MIASRDYSLTGPEGRRTDGPAIRDTLIGFAVLGALGTLLYQTWGSIFFYDSCGDSRWHECGHSTAFEKPWMDKAICCLASFPVLRNGTLWRWSHTRDPTHFGERQLPPTARPFAELSRAAA